MDKLEMFPFPREKLEEMDSALADSVRGWAEKEVAEKRLELKEDYEELLRPAMRELFAGIGLQRILWPEEYGGDGHNEPRAAMTLTAALEQAGRADTGIGFLLSNIIAVQSAVVMRPEVNKDICSAFAGLFASEEVPALISLVLTVYGEGKDEREFQGKALQAAAREGKKEWTITGSGMRPLCCGSDAGLIGVLCAVEGAEEPAFILVPSGATGIKRGPVFKKLGLAASRNADLTLNKVKVPLAYCAWRGLEGYRAMLSWLHLGVCATCVGALLATYEIIKEWGDTRVIKGRGQIFKENPLAASLMAEIAKETSLDRILAYHLAGMLAEPEVYGEAGSEGLYITALMIAHQITNSAEKAINHTMELMASAGYAKEWQLERYWRDTKTVQIHLGNYELAKMDMARYFYQCQTL